MKAETPASPTTLVNGWPVDEEGKPLALVTMGASEKIGLPQYSNVDIGPASVSRFVKDEPNAIMDALRIATQQCEQVIAEERGPIIEMAKTARAS
jgi:hypothetical protein